MAKIDLKALLKKADKIVKAKKGGPPSKDKAFRPKIKIPSRSARSRRSRSPRSPGWHPFVTPPEGTVLFVDVVRRVFGTAYVPMDLLAIAVRSFLVDHGQVTAGVAATATPGELAITAGGSSAQRSSNRQAISKLLPKLGLSADETNDAPYLVWAMVVDGGFPMLVPEKFEDEVFVALLRAGRFAGIGLSSEARRRLKNV